MALNVQNIPGLGVRFTAVSPPLGPDKAFQSPLQSRYSGHDLVFPVSFDTLFTRFFHTGAEIPRSGNDSLINIGGEEYQLCGNRVSANSKSGTSVFIAEEMRTGMPVIVKKLAIGELQIVKPDESTPLADVLPEDKVTPLYSPFSSVDQGLRDLFSREGTLELPPYTNILTANKFQTTGNTMIIIMELLHGVSFRDLLNLIKSDSLNPGVTLVRENFTPKEKILAALSSDQKISVKKELELIALDSLLQIVGAIRHLEENEIVHLDIKPPNINFGRDYTPKLLDFGNYLDANHKYNFKSPLGTREYLSPEQIPDEIGTVSTLSFDSRSDLFSLTVILYELFAGKTPFFRAGNDKPSQVKDTYNATKNIDYEKLTGDKTDLELLEFIHSQLVRLEERSSPCEYEIKLRSIVERLIN